MNNKPTRSKASSKKSKTTARLASLKNKVFGKKSKPNEPKKLFYELPDTRTKVFFGIVFLVLAGLLVYVLMPYLSALVLALLLAALTHPLYKKLRAKLKWSPRYVTLLVIAGLTVFGTALLLFLIKNIVVEAASLSNTISAYLDSGQINTLSDKIQKALNDINISVDSQSITQYIAQILGQISTQLAGFAIRIVSGIFELFIWITVFISALIVLIPRMADARKLALEISPLGKAITADYIEKTRLLLRGAVLGSFVISFTAATIMGLTFYAMGIPNALLFATLAFFLGFIPFLGTPIFTFGAAIIFFLLGDYPQAAALVLLQLLVLNQLELVFRPLTVPKKVRIHPGLMIIAVFSGLATFGLLGLVFGPVILVLFISTVEIYRQNYGAERTKISTAKSSAK